MNDGLRDGDSISPVDIMLHPLISAAVTLRTGPIDEMYKIVKRRVILQDLGCSFSGPSGAGKTRAILMLTAMLEVDFPNIYVLIHNAHNKIAPSVRGFFQHFLGSAGYNQERGTGEDMRQLFTSILVDRARASGLNVVVFMIDEANSMVLDDFLFLKDVGNDLNLKGVQLISFLVGQSPQLEIALDNLTLAGKNDLVARFGLSRFKVRQNNCLEDVVRVFKTIDAQHYPPGSQVSWPGFFMPKAVAAGLRFEQQARNFIKALRSTQSPESRKLKEFPTRQMFYAVHSFLFDMISADATDFVLPKDAWKLAIEDARAREAEELEMRVPKRKSSNRSAK